jgi:hypothetical protein
VVFHPDLFPIVSESLDQMGMGHQVSSPFVDRITYQQLRSVEDSKEVVLDPDNDVSSNRPMWRHVAVTAVRDTAISADAPEEPSAGIKDRLRQLSNTPRSRSNRSLMHSCVVPWMTRSLPTSQSSKPWLASARPRNWYPRQNPSRMNRIGRSTFPLTQEA